MVDSWFICTYCLQRNDIEVDISGGAYQEYVEDCQVCCRPNQLSIRINADLMAAEIDAAPL